MIANETVGRTSEPTPLDLVGHFRVQRTAGFLPLRFSKRFDAGARGVTALGGMALFPFRVTHSTRGRVELRYVLLPIRDELVRSSQGWVGRGLLWGIEFCRFKLVPDN